MNIPKNILRYLLEIPKGCWYILSQKGTNSLSCSCMAKRKNSHSSLGIVKRCEKEFTIRCCCFGEMLNVCVVNSESEIKRL